MEKQVGFIDVKHSAVHFYVQKSQSFWDSYKPMPFEVEVLNVGKAMDLNSGMFTVPRAGIYVFSFTGIKEWNAGNTGVYLMLNGKERIAKGYGTSSESKGNYTIALHCTLQLRKDDQIYLFIDGGAIHDDQWHYSKFTGSLIEENLA